MHKLYQFAERRFNLRDRTRDVVEMEEADLLQEDEFKVQVGPTMEELERLKNKLITLSYIFHFVERKKVDLILNLHFC